MECSTLGRTSFSHAQLERSFAEYLHVAFNQVNKNFRSFLFPADLYLAFEKNQAKISSQRKKSKGSKRNAALDRKNTEQYVL